MSGCASSTGCRAELDKPRLDALQSAFGLNGATNMEVRFAWLDLAVANRYDPALPSLEQFLLSKAAASSSSR